MRNDNLQQYVTLRRQLTQEREQLSQRLATINEALGELSGSDAAHGPVAHVAAAKGGYIGNGFAASTPSGKRTMSAAARRRIATAQRKRWAAARGTSAGKQAAAK